MKKGLSIVEMLAVVVIMGIIAAIAVPLIGNAIDKARKNSFISDIYAIQTSSELYCNANRGTNVCLAEKTNLQNQNKLSQYISKDFNSYKKASVHFKDGFLVDLKNDNYETREVVYNSDEKTFVYTQKEILPNENISNFVIKNKD